MQQQYKYTAINLQKEKFSGIFMAKDEADLAVQLSKQGLYLVSASLYSDKSPSAFFTLGTGKVSLSELTTFCRQYSIMINSGISLIGGLEILKDQKFTRYFRQLLQVIYEDVKGGMMLSDAMAKHKGVFPAFFRSMIKVGETSGKLDIVMNSLADYYEKDSALKKKIISAISYPSVILGMAVVIIIMMLAFVIPNFKNTLTTMNVEGTWLTNAVFALSDFLVEYWLYMLAAVIVIGLVLFGIGKTKKGKYFYDWLKIHSPFIGRVNTDIITARFARGFGLLLSSGMDMTEALDSVIIIFGNKDAEKRFRAAVEDIKHGMTISIAFDKYRLFPAIMTQMISVGEKTSALDDVLNRSCNFFDDAVETSLNSVTSKLQPILLLFLAVIILVLFLAIYSPILAIMQNLG